MIETPTWMQDKLAPSSPMSVASSAPDGEIGELLSHVPPDIGYQDWLNALMAVHAATGGAGIDLADEWSRRGTKYRGRAEIEAKWRSFKGSGIGSGTLGLIASQHGANPSEIARRWRGTIVEADDYDASILLGKENLKPSGGPASSTMLYPVMWFSDIDVNVVKEWTVEDWWGLGELIVPYGAPGAGCTQAGGLRGYRIPARSKGARCASPTDMPIPLPESQIIAAVRMIRAGASSRQS